MTNKTNDWHKFVWKIKNFSYCWHKNGEYISSPSFRLEGTNWHLELFPHGNISSKYIACFLKRESRVYEHVKCKLSFIDPEGNSLIERIWGDGKHFKRNEIAGNDSFIQRKVVFVDKRTKFLPYDTLTVCCHISKSSNFRLCQTMAHTHIEVQWQTITKEIDIYSIDTFNTANIEVLSASIEKPVLKIIVSSHESSCCDENLIIKILFGKSEQRKFTTCNVFLLGTTGTKLKCGKSDIWFDPNETEQKWTFPLIFTKWELLARKDLYLPNGILSFLFECSSSMGISKEAIISYSVEEFACSDGEKASDLDVLGNLYKENILCDVNLQTSTKTFPAHRAILSAGSPVFKAMFTNDTKEAATNRVDIEDLDDETIRRFLLYIYTNTVEDLRWQMASQLYVAADKYSIESLKDKCSSILKYSICTSNVYEILDLAEMHQDDCMKNSVREYILLHDKDVIGSEEWKSFELKNPQLASETIRHVYRKAKRF